MHLLLTWCEKRKPYKVKSTIYSCENVAIGLYNLIKKNMQAMQAKSERKFLFPSDLKKIN